MTTEITIFDIPEQEQIITKSQKQLEYEELELKSGLSNIDVWSMYEMDEMATLEQVPVSSLPSVMLNYILKYTIAILFDELIDNKAYHLTLQSDTLIYAIKNNKNVVIPANQQIKVSGIVLPDVFIKFYNKYVLNHYDYVSDKDIALSGHFGIKDFQTMKFTQQRNSMTHPGNINISNNKIVFSSDEECSKIFSKIIEYIKYTTKFYNICYPIIFNDLHKPDITGSSLIKWKIKYDPKLFNESILKLLNKAQSAKFGDSFSNENLFLLYNNGLDKLYNTALYVGTDSDLFKKDYIIFQKNIEKRNIRISQLNEGYKIQLAITIRRAISVEKFGISNYLALNDGQKKIVDTAYDNISHKLLNAEKHANVDLFAKLRISMSNQTPKEMISIIKQIEDANTAKNLAGIALLPGNVCPHLYNEAITLRNVFAKPNATVEVRNFLISEYAFPADKQGYFCKICGEKIAEVDNTALLKFNGDRSGISYEDSPLQTLIWKEAMYIISTNVRFTTPMPIKPLVNSLAQGLKEIVSHEEAKIYRSKTNTTDNIKDLLSLYAAIYIYASLCALMMHNPGKLIFARDPPADRKKNVESSILAKEQDDPAQKTKSILADDDSQKDDAQKDDAQKDEPETKSILAKKKTAKGAGKQRNKKFKYVSGGKVITDSKMAEKIYLNTAIKLLFISKDSIISRLTNMTPDFIKQIFVKTAYAWANKYIKPIQIEQESQSHILGNVILMDPFYRYLIYVQNLSGKKVEFADIKRALGRDEKAIIADIKNNVGMFNTVEDVKPWHVPSKKPNFDEYTFQSFNMCLDYYRDEVYAKHFIPQHAQVGEYYDKYKNLIELEKKIWYEMSKEKAVSSLKIDIPVNLVRKYNNFSPNIIDLAQHYCSSGERHKTGAYIYKHNNKDVEITKAEINEWLNSKNTTHLAQYEKLVLVDEKCEKCNKYIRSAKSAKTSNSLLTMFSKLDDITAFYQYYETRCPKGNLHEMSKLKCSICGFETEFSRTRDAKYYDKYKSAFNDIQQEKKTIIIQSLERVANKKPLLKAEKVDYKYTLRNTAEWSQITGINYNLIVNIGLYYNVKYIDLESSSVNPSKTTTFSQSRALRFKTHILRIIREYSTIINYEKVIDFPLWMRELLDEQKKIDLKDIKKSMPDISDFVSLDEKYVYTLSVENYTNFLQEYLAGIIVKINNKRADKYKTLADGLIKYFTNTLLEYERMLSIPDPVFAESQFVGDATDDSADSLSDVDSVIEVASVDENVEVYNENDLELDGFDVEDEGAVWDVED